MNDEVEKLKVQIYNSLPTCQGEDSIYCTSRTPSPVCKKAIDEILALFQKAQVEAVRAELKDVLKNCPMPTLSYEDIENRLASLFKEDGETK